MDVIPFAISLFINLNSYKSISFVNEIFTFQRKKVL